MSLDRTAREKLVRALAASMIEHAEELTSLDQAIGDGDHGLNMKRGFEAVLATLPGLADKSLPEMLKAIGMTLVMKVGGASGPLVGTFFMELGKALPEQPTRADLVAATDKAIDAVKARGRSEAGQKTLLDVLVPVQAIFAAGGNAVPLAWTGGDPEGGLGTNVAGILEAIEVAWSPAGVAILVDLGGAETNSEMAVEMLPEERRARVVVCNAPVVEGAVIAATESSGGSSLAAVKRSAEEFYA